MFSQNMRHDCLTPEIAGGTLFPDTGTHSMPVSVQFPAAAASAADTGAQGTNMCAWDAVSEGSDSGK